MKKRGKPVIPNHASKHFLTPRRSIRIPAGKAERVALIENVELITPIWVLLKDINFFKNGARGPQPVGATARINWQRKMTDRITQR